MKYQELLEKQEELEDEALKVFHTFDTDGSGSIDISELSNFMVTLSEVLDIHPPSSSEITKVLK